MARKYARYKSAGRRAADDRKQRQRRIAIELTRLYHGDLAKHLLAYSTGDERAHLHATLADLFPDARRKRGTWLAHLPAIQAAGRLPVNGWAEELAGLIALEITNAGISNRQGLSLDYWVPPRHESVAKNIGYALGLREEDGLKVGAQLLDHARLVGLIDEYQTGAIKTVVLTQTALSIWRDLLKGYTYRQKATLSSTPYGSRDPIAVHKHPTQKIDDRTFPRAATEVLHATVRATAWQVNKRVLNVMLQMESKNAPKKADPDWQQFATPEMATALDEAEPYGQAADNHRFWIDLRADYRGRIYQAGSLRFTGASHHIQSLLQFADGVIVKRGSLAAEELGGYVSKMWDKGETSDWAEGEGDRLLRAIAKDPLRNRQWLALPKALKHERFRALAAAFAWRDYRDNQPVRLPISWDASTSGLQIYGCLMRDERALRSTGLWVDVKTVKKPGDWQRVVVEPSQPTYYSDVAETLRSADGHALRSIAGNRLRGNIPWASRSRHPKTKHAQTETSDGGARDRSYTSLDSRKRDTCEIPRCGVCAVRKGIIDQVKAEVQSGAIHGVNAAILQRAKDLERRYLERRPAKVSRRIAARKLAKDCRLTLTKREVKAVGMPVFYGASFRNSAESLALDDGNKVTTKTIRKNGRLELVQTIKDYDLYYDLAGLIRHTAARQADAFVRVRDWLKHVAKSFADADKPIGWISPTGFIVTCDSRVMESEIAARPRMAYAKNPTDISQQRPTGALDHDANKRGIAANVIHSLDAAVLVKTLELGSGLEIPRWGCVHDCFAVPPGFGEKVRTAYRLALYHTLIGAHKDKAARKSMRDTLKAIAADAAIDKSLRAAATSALARGVRADNIDWLANLHRQFTRQLRVPLKPPPKHDTTIYLEHLGGPRAVKR